LNKPPKNIPAAEGARKLAPGNGRRFDIAGVHLTWKVKGEDSGYAFSVCEQDLGPGEGVSLHSHPYAEVFYILEGSVDFCRILDGKEEWISCEVNSTMILPPNSFHAFYNKTRKLCRLLGISTQLHQAFFDAVERADASTPFSALPASELMARVAAIGAEYCMNFAPPDVDADGAKS
jgi:quercetin dioxygenase-like cupin family protein